MPFRDYTRVTYSKNPLQQVICQLRFSPVLRIETELPAKFQDAIRQDYPLFTETQEGNQELPIQIKELMPAEMIRLLGNSQRRLYNFSSLDKSWVATLSRDFIALTTQNYTRWEEFNSRFSNLLAVLLQEYSPIVFSRVGLRYQNLIRRSKLDLQNVQWSELLEPHIAGVLAASDLNSDSVLNSTSDIEIRLANNYGVVRISHGVVEDTETKEQYYLIDSDFFIENIDTKERGDVVDRLEKFNHRARRLFRWCITERLHNAMEPNEIRC